MAVRIQLRRDTAANWSSTNPVLNNGEPGFDTTNKILKIGDGVTAWNDLDNKFATDAQGALADSALQPGDIGVTVQGYSANTVIDANYVATENSYTTTEKNKLAGIEAGATANDTDANLLSRANHTGTQTASTISDFDTEVSNNTDVAANTSARHDAVTVVDSSEIDFTLTGQQITASIVAGSIDESKLDASVNASLDKADAGREVLTANRTYYVRTDGNDSNDGLSDATGGAFLTWQKAIDTAASLDTSIYDVTIQCGGTGSRVFTEAISLKPLFGIGTLHIKGDAANPSQVEFTGADGGFCIKTNGVNGKWSIQYFKLSKLVSAGSCLYIQEGKVLMSDIEFGTATVGASNHIRIDRKGELGRLSSVTNYSISGGANYHLTNNGYVSLVGTGTCTITGTPAFNTFALCAEGGGMVAGLGFTYSGNATGVRYNVSINGYMRTFGGGANYFPGGSAGVTSNGGLYV